MHTASIPPVNPAPATITAVFATQTGHIFPSSLFGQPGASPGFRRLLLNKSCVLALQQLGGTRTPGLGNGLRIRIGEDVLFSFLQPIENPSRRGLGRSLGYVEASRHISVDGTREHRMDRYALAGQEHSQ